MIYQSKFKSHKNKNTIHSQIVYRFFCNSDLFLGFGPNSTSLAILWLLTTNDIRQAMNFMGREQSLAAWMAWSGWESDGVKKSCEFQGGACGKRVMRVLRPRKPRKPPSKSHRPCRAGSTCSLLPRPSFSARSQRGVINAAAAALCLLHHRTLIAGWHIEQEKKSFIVFCGLSFESFWHAFGIDLETSRECVSVGNVAPVPHREQHRMPHRGHTMCHTVRKVLNIFLSMQHSSF